MDECHSDGQQDAGPEGPGHGRDVAEDLAPDAAAGGECGRAGEIEGQESRGSRHGQQEFQRLPGLPPPGPVGVAGNDGQGEGQGGQQTQQVALGAEVVGGDPGQQDGEEHRPGQQDGQGCQRGDPASQEIEDDDRCQDGQEVIHHLDRDEHQPVAELEFHLAHGRRGLAGFEVFGQVGRPHRAVFHPEAGALLDLVGGHAGRAQLGQDQLAVLHHFLETRRLDPLHDLVRAEGALAGRAPHVDPLRVQHQDVSIDPGQGAAQGVEAEGVVGRDEDRGIRRGPAEGIQPRRHPVPLAAHPDAGQEMIPTIRLGDAVRHRRDLNGG